jgi:excisionase family DNA binding protein
MREQPQQPASGADTINPPETDGLLTAEEVASLLQVTPAWVYAETRRRRIPHIRLGRYVRYRRFALQVWMDEMERSSTGRPSPHTR